MPGSVDPRGLGLDPALDLAGINLAGVLAPAAYDACVEGPWKTATLLPACRSVVVLGSGGRDFFRAFRASPEYAEHQAGRCRDPQNAFLARVVRSAAAFETTHRFEAEAGFYFERRAGRFADFISLGRRAGLGTPSRLAILIHPEYGPWFAIRALLLTARELAPTTADESFAPCTGCPAPCAQACPGAALAVSGFDLDRCVATSRREVACQLGCAARRACRVGPTHRYDPDAEAWHRRAALPFPIE